MIKKLLENKKILILIVVIVLVLVGVLMAVLSSKNSKEDERPGISIETDKNKDENSQISEDEAEEVYNGGGLEVEDTLDESVNTIDGSGDWNDKSNDSGSKEQGNKTDSGSTDDTKEESTYTEDDADGELNSDTLVDDKVWGEPS